MSTNMLPVGVQRLSGMLCCTSTCTETAARHCTRGFCSILLLTDSIFVGLTNSIMVAFALHAQLHSLATHPAPRRWAT
jgi:hypothetical protein